LEQNRITSRPFFRTVIMVFSITLIFLFGFTVSRWGSSRMDGNLRSLFLERAIMIADSLDPGRISSLSGSVDDLGKDRYNVLKRHLQSARSLYRDVRFLYILELKPDGRVVFLVDSEPEGSPDESLPGDLLDKPTPPLLNAF